MKNERIAISGSPNKINEISIDILEKFINMPLMGSLVTLDAKITDQDGNESELLVLGQVATLETRNRWHEDASLKNYLKRRGELPNLTEVGDITSGKLHIVGAYKAREDNGETKYEKARLSVPVGSGLDICVADAALVREVMKADKGYAFLGRFYGTKDVPAPVYVKHFGPFQDGGIGEAYMGGVFGPSGSGKSVMAANLDALWATNEDMGLLFLDPQSEFSQNGFAGRSGLGSLDH